MMASRDAEPVPMEGVETTAAFLGQVDANRDGALPHGGAAALKESGVMPSSPFSSPGKASTEASSPAMSADSVSSTAGAGGTAAGSGVGGVAAAAQGGTAAAASAGLTVEKKKPTIIINIGMAGSGKSTMMHQMSLQLLKQKKRIYGINLDPAVSGTLRYPCAIDIRNTINYKEVMKHFKLGPNGGIMTALNLFATKFDQVLELLEKRKTEVDYVLIDTPGQIEVFTDCFELYTAHFHEMFGAVSKTCVCTCPVVDTDSLVAADVLAESGPSAA